MTLELLHGTLRDRPRHAIHVVRVDKILEFPEVAEIAERMRAHVLSKSGEQDPNIVIVHGDSRETLRLVGETHAVTRVRSALFNAAISFSPLRLEAADQ
jgi:3'-phosphoadenosine 5'-phosphosulfate sulfotransferase (PAPS reductase)/FAD synthetase